MTDFGGLTNSFITNAMILHPGDDTGDLGDNLQSTAHDTLEHNDHNTSDDDSMYKCGICQDLLYRPVTLTCQHNYCYGCIEKYYNGRSVAQNQNEYIVRTKQDKCPLCNIPYTLAPIENTLMTSLLMERYPAEYEAKAKHFETVHKLAELKKDLELSMRKEIWNTISTNFNTNYPPEDDGAVHFINTPTPSYASYVSSWSRSGRNWDNFTESLVKALPVMGSGVLLYAGMVLVDRFLKK